MNTSDYIKEAERHLTDQKFYKKVIDNLTEEHTMWVNTFLHGLNKKG